MLAGGGYSVAYTERRLNNLKYILIATDYQLNNNEAGRNAEKRLATFKWDKLSSKLKIIRPGGINIIRSHLSIFQIRSYRIFTTISSINWHQQPEQINR